MAGENGRIEYCHGVADAVDTVLRDRKYPPEFRQRVRTSAVLSTANTCYESHRHEERAEKEALGAAQREFAEDCRWHLEELLERTGLSDKLEAAVEMVAKEDYDLPGEERTVDVVVQAVAAKIRENQNE